MALSSLRPVGMKTPRTALPSRSRLSAMEVVRDYVAKGALSMVDWANHKPENSGKKPKVGGHQASSMSSVDLLCALYLHTKEPQDRVAVKPHAAPVVYSIMHLFGLVATEQMNRLREFGGPQPYPTKLKNPLFIDYTTSSEALGVCAAIYDAYGAKLHNRSLRHVHDTPEVNAVYWAHCGDGELTEGQIDESLYDAGRWGLDNLVWVVDLNRQSLDRVMDDSLGGRLEDWVVAKFQSHQWHVSDVLRWGHRAEELFAADGGDVLKDILDSASDALFHPLMCVDGATLRAIFMGDVTHPDPPTRQLLERYAQRLRLTDEQRRAITSAIADVSDAELSAAISHLGGHDMAALTAAYDKARHTEGAPSVIVAHTVKGYQTSAAGHPENHGGLLPRDEVAVWGATRGIPTDEPYPTPNDPGAVRLIDERRRALFDDADHRYVPSPVPELAVQLGAIKAPRRSTASTGEIFQSLNMALLRDPAIAPWVHFGAPDVGQTTHLGPVIKATGVFAPRPGLPDTFAWLRAGRKLAFDWRPSDRGQFHAMGIAEGNAMLWAYAFGRRKKRVEGRAPVLPVVTVYDKFFERGFNQLDYAVYSDARFIAVGTPSGTGLSRETATHQSLQTLRMMMDLPGIISYEPAFAVDVWAIYRWALGQLWDDAGEAVYLRLTTQPLAQPTTLPDDVAAQAVRGGYWLLDEDERAPKQGQPHVIFVASGRKLDQVRHAAQRLSQDHGIGSRILNVTSYEVLWRDWDAYNNDPSAWDDPARSYRLHELFADADVNAPLIVTGDHLPSVAEWLPGALQRIRGFRFLGPRRNGEAGALEAVDALHGMGVEDLVEAALADIRWRRKHGLI